MMQNMMEAMYTAMFKVLAKPGTASNLATFTRNYYHGLIARGFSKEGALKIVVAWDFRCRAARSRAERAPGSFSRISSAA